MARQDFTIRVTRKGEIIVEAEGMEARQVKDLIQFFEETLGPAKVLDGDGPEGGGRVELEDRLGRESVEEERTPERLRLREGE